MKCMNCKDAGCMNCTRYPKPPSVTSILYCCERGERLGKMYPCPECWNRRGYDAPDLIARGEGPDTISPEEKDSYEPGDGDPYNYPNTEQGREDWWNNKPPH